MISWILSLFSLFPASPALAPMYPEGSFRAEGPASGFEWLRPHAPEPRYDSIIAPSTGVLRSGVFKLPSAIHFYEAGFPSRPGMRIFLQDENGKRTLDLRQRIDPGYAWKIHFWKLPSVWVGANVRLIAEDNGKGDYDWLGITAPEAGSEPVMLSFFRALYVSLSLVLESLVFLLPGLAAAALVSKEEELPLLRLVSVVICASAATAYAAFYIYLASAPLGKIFSVVAAILSMALVIRDRRFLRRIPASREALACLGLTLLVSIFYCSIGLLYQTDDGVGEQAQVRYNLGFMPPDNILPEMLAERLYKDQAPKPFLFGYWHSSDRPPLQSGITLLTLPLAPPSPLVRQYLLVSIFAQCLWVPGLWVLMRIANLGKRYMAPVFGFAIFSALCSFHSFYVWPKLLSAAFAFLAIGFVLQNVWTWLDITLASAALALGILSHTGVLFTIVPLAIYALVKRRFPGWRGLVMAAAIALVFLLPWRWYQTSYDPPGDALIKWNMAGAEDPALFPKPFFQLLSAGYAKLTPAQYVAGKVQDLKVLFTGGDVDAVNWADLRSILVGLESAEFFHLFWAVGLLNLCFVARLFAPPAQSVRFADLCMVLVLGSILLWFLVMYAPGATLIHQWSLGNVLLMFLALVIYLVDAGPRLVYPLLAVQALVVFPLLIFAKPFVQRTAGAVFDAPLDPGMAVVALVTFVAIVLFGRRAKLQEANELSA